MKKSLAMLFAMFMLGACSTKDDAVNSEWKEAVGGKTVTSDSAGETIMGVFSSDATTFTYEVAGDSIDLSLESSTANSATYTGKVFGASMNITFTDANAEAGTINMDDGNGKVPVYLK